MGLLLLRFRWPVILSLVIGVVLFLTLEPRPESVRLVRTPQSIVVFSNDRYAVSPSGRYLLFFDYSNELLTYYDLQSSSRVFELKKIAHIESGFDSEDGLSLTTINKDKPWNWLGWYCGAGGELQKIFTSNIDDRTKERSYREVQLSPDGRTWLQWAVTRADKDEIELVDARTGLIRATLAYQPRKVKESRGRVTACISQDSRVIAFITLKDRFDPETEAWIDFYDLNTGQHKPPGGYLEHGYTGAIIFDGQTVKGFIQREGNFYLQSYSVEHELREWKLADVSSQLSQEKQSDLGTRFRTIFNYPISIDKGVMFSSENFAGSSIAIRYVRCDSGSKSDVIAWKMIDTGKLQRIDEQTDVASLQCNSIDMIGVLPSFKLLFRCGPTAPPDWLGSLDAWRNLYVSWLPRLVSTRFKLKVYDPVADKEGETLTLPSHAGKIWYHDKQQAIYVVETQDSELILHKYAYPFQRPWKLILSWAGYVLAAMVLLQLISISWKWMTTKEAKVSLPA